jgi:hypothetical protein
VHPNEPLECTAKEIRKVQAIRALGENGIAINVVTLTNNRQLAKARGVRPQGKSA